MRIFFYSILISILLNSYSFSDTRFEKDLKKLSKYNFFVNNEGNRYELNQNVDKNKTIILIYSHGSGGSERNLQKCNKSWWQIPPTIYQLDGVKIKDFTIKTYQLCKGARGFSQKDGDLFYRIFNPNNGNFVTNEVQFTQGPSTTLGLIEGTYVFDSYREGLSGISVDNNGGFTIRYNADLPVTMFDGEQGEFYTYSPMDGIIIGNPVEPPEQEINMQDILNGNPVVLATGGGAVTSKGTTTLINQKALSIWLKADIDLLHRRTLRRKHRPLLTHENSLATLKKLANSREKYYKQSDITFQIKDEKISLSAKRLLESIKNFNQE